jgi:hypothetical protein
MKSLEAALEGTGRGANALVKERKLSKNKIEFMVAMVTMRSGGCSKETYTFNVLFVA